ncbi:MAG: arylesterase [Butyrivibrio sp.]|nr:arylesterase [Butyrivibrio sp.]
MKKILAFGDSNTWGLIPGTTPFKRYPRNVRWTGVLQNRLSDAKVIEEGLCGRTTVFEDEHRPGRKGINSLNQYFEGHESVDYAILMLGTNDCKSYYHVSADTIGEGIEECLDVLLKHLEPEKILLVSPIALGDEVWRPDKDPDFDKESVVVSKQLKDVYKTVADSRGVHFLAAADYVTASEVDNEHMDGDSHKIFANVVYESLKAIS